MAAARTSHPLPLYQHACTPKTVVKQEQLLMQLNDYTINQLEQAIYGKSNAAGDQWVGSQDDDQINWKGTACDGLSIRSLITLDTKTTTLIVTCYLTQTKKSNGNTTNNIKIELKRSAGGWNHSIVCTWEVKIQTIVDVTYWQYCKPFIQWLRSERDKLIQRTTGA